MRRIGATRCRAAPGPDRPTSRSPGRLGAALLAAATLALPADVSAQDGAAETEPPPLVGDRPDFTESASVVTRLQLESGYTMESEGSSEVHTVGELLFRLPASRRMELRVGVPSWTWVEAEDPARKRPDVEIPGEVPRGMTDASLGIKLALRDPGPGGAGPTVAVLASTSIPTGGDVGSDGLHPGGLVAADVDVSDRLSLGVNAGVASAESEATRHVELSGSLALGIGLGEKVGLFLEGYGFAPVGEGPGASSVVDGGLTWLAGSDLQLDVRLGAGLSGPSPDLILGSGVIWRP